MGAVILYHCRLSHDKSALFTFTMLKAVRKLTQVGIDRFGYCCYHVVHWMRFSIPNTLVTAIPSEDPIMRKSKVLPLFLSMLWLFGVLAALTPITYAQDEHPQSSGATIATLDYRKATQWDGHSPMIVGQVYKLPGCNKTTPPQAPCYSYVTSSIIPGGVTILSSNITQTQRCTRNMVDNTPQHNVVMQLWEDVNVTWVHP